MDKKMITVLLVIAIVISVLSLVVTLSLNTDNMSLRERTTTIIQKPDFSSGQVGITIEPTPENQPTLKNQNA